MSKDTKKLFQTKFIAEIYMKLPLADLILGSIYLVVSRGETCTFERLVAESFNNFPKVFSFRRYPKWPDSLKFDRPLRTLREKGYIVGSARDSFSLNKYGENKARDILKKLNKRITPQRDTYFQLPVRSSDDRIIEYIKKSFTFLSYLSDPKSFFISDQELRNLLRCTLETPERVVKQNMQYYIKVARDYNEVEVERFLLCCKRKFLRGGVYGKGPAY